MKVRHDRAFTIVELLVVVSIIALLISILLPAIGKARDQAKVTLSVANLRNLGTAQAAYAANYNDRQLTLVNDNITAYGIGACSAYTAFAEETGGMHPNIVLGWGPGEDFSALRILWQYYLDGSEGGHHCWAGQPIAYGGDGFGNFRFCHQTRAFSPYLSGRYYDPVFFAPKDVFLYEIVKDGFESPAQFASIGADDGTDGNVLYTSSYCMSPAAMYAPQVLKYDEEEDKSYRNPWDMMAGLRSPSMSQALYPNLKTHMIEHAWLQGAPVPCNPGFVTTAGTYNGCEPYYFNHGWESTPMTLFYDGHVEGVGVREAMRADARYFAQTKTHGLWTRDVPTWEDDGYYIDYGYDQAATSFHILTTDGIRGRDRMSK